MKRFGILLCLVLMVAAFPVFSEESVLIDFAQLTADRDDGENEATYIDFSDKAGAGFTDEEKEHMKTSLSVANWEVKLASSARTVTNKRYSYVLPAPVSDGATKYAGETVLGARIHFPEESYNSWAIVQPPFDIPAYERIDEQDLQGTKFNGYGVVKNVGVVKSVTINVLGKNFPNGFGIILEDENRKQRNIFMDYLDFDGWKTITWNNPNYISDVRDRDLKKNPLYPKSSPFVKLAGFIFYKDAAQDGGDFITYIKDVTVTYDKAVLELQTDIDDEALWGILGDREEARRNAEYTKLGNKQVLRYIETQLMHAEEEGADAGASDATAE
ncbi:MAG: flagellar filament outer layer protein FlaA [Spirochaetales bacterium]|nr:flagellar filament outer layer protein FlaA [Spirochaetales bacterium]